MRQRPIKIKHRVTISCQQQKGRDEARRDRNLTVVKSDLGRKRITNPSGHNTRRYLVTKHRCHTQIQHRPSDISDGSHSPTIGIL
jgi:hypothetical protein